MYCRRLLSGCSLVVAAFFLFCRSVLACPMCWSALGQTPEGRKMAGGFQSGILLLMATPFVVAGVIGFRIYKAHSSREVASSHGEASPWK